MSEGEWVTGNVAVTIDGIPLKMQMTVPAKPVKPHRMLPIFQQMTNAMVDISVNALESDGKAISCKAGCGACCRQPVPISETEVYQIAELVDAMPEPRRTEVRQKFASAVDHFKSIGWFDRLNSHFAAGRAAADDNDFKQAIDVVLEYFYEGVPCPFLENESCSIHQSRPVACREYLVTSPAENCSKPTAQTVAVVDLLIKPSRTVRGLGATGALNSAGYLTLIRALELAEAVPESFVRKTGERWMADFFSNLSNSRIPKKGIKPARRKSPSRRPKRKRA
jgi:Fe-S-cluster containining protein